MVPVGEELSCFGHGDETVTVIDDNDNDNDDGDGGDAADGSSESIDRTVQGE
jgi:hypothetical protein